MGTINAFDGEGRRIPKGSKARPARYVARWRTPDGKSREKWFERKVDAERHLVTVEGSKLVGAYVDPSAGKVTVEGYSRQWAAGQPWRPTTRDRMERVLESQVIPTFGPSHLRAVRRSDVQAWVGRMSSVFAPSTTEAYFRVLAAVMIAARRDHLIHESPCDRITLPRRESNPASLVPLTSDQVLGLAEAVPARYRALVVASAGLGLRQGEACGLSVDRVDFLRGKVRIDRQLVTPSSGPVAFGPPKTASSNRVLPLPASVRDALAAHLAAYPVGELGLVFTSSTGAALRRSTWSDAFRSAAVSLGLEASSHDLRHYCASQLISAGASIKAVQRYLGHKNASETLDVYGHLMPSDEDRITAAIDAGLTPSRADCGVGVGLGPT